MSPEASPPPLLLLLLLPFAALNTESTEAPPKNDTGREFIVAFPENIAYYHPDDSENKVWITSLNSGTNVWFNGNWTLLNKETWSLNVRKELGKLEVSGDGIHNSYETVVITSDKDIVVQAFSNRSNSMQSALVVPTDRLGTKYFIPPIYQISAAASKLDVNGNGSSIHERGPFRLIIVNTDQENSVTITGADTRTMKLYYRKVAQIPIRDKESLEVVEADHPVAVLIAHPCAARLPCSCGLLYAMLQPARSKKAKFPIPPALAGQDEAFVLLAESGSRSADAFNPDSAEVETSGTAVLYRQDLLLTLISEDDFASCYVVTQISADENYIVIVVDKDETDGIHVGKDALESSKAEWKDLKGTHYKTSKLIPVPAVNVVVWHESSKMGVYYMGKVGETWFGHPAPTISSYPDHRGCALSPEVMKVPETEGSWQKSVATCKNEGLQMVSLWEESRQKHICNLLSKDDSKPPDQVWIGTRRSSATLNWYWLFDTTLQYTNWDKNEPGSVDKGQCAVLNVKDKDHCRWRDEECCNSLRPLCYKDPLLLLF